MLLFAGHDPGSKNHIQPIYSYASELGHRCIYLDLASDLLLTEENAAQSYIRNLIPSIFVGGTSLNQGEWALLRSCKGLGIPTILFVDLSAKSKVDPIPIYEFPDKFMVTNPGCVKELIEFGAPPDSIILTGSTHLENLAKADKPNQDVQTKKYYHINNNSRIIPFFCSPNTADTIKALESLVSIIPLTKSCNVLFIVRPHPRSPNKDLIKGFCDNHQLLIFDLGQEVCNADLLNISSCSLSMASTVSLESLVKQIPSAFYQIGWEFEEWNDLYSNIESIPRIRDLGQMKRFLDQTLTDPELHKVNLEYYSGSLKRSWNVIKELGHL